MKILYYFTTYPFDEAIYWGEKLLTLLEKSWKYERFWKWYYRLIPVIVVLIWVLIIVNHHYEV